MGLVHWTTNKMIRATVDRDAMRMAVLLSYSCVMRLTMLTKSCAYTMYVHSGEV